MDLFDERVLAVLNEGNPKGLPRQLLDEVGFDRNTLKLRLKCSGTQSLVVKEKTVSNGGRRLKYVYSVSSRVARVRRPLGFVRNDCNTAVQLRKTPPQVLERGLLQTNQKQMRLRKLPSNPKKERTKSDFWPILEHICARKNKKEGEI